LFLLFNSSRTSARTQTLSHMLFRFHRERIVCSIVLHPVWICNCFLNQNQLKGNTKVNLKQIISGKDFFHSFNHWIVLNGNRKINYGNKQIKRVFGDISMALITPFDMQ
jgi:hypothetical protein